MNPKQNLIKIYDEIIEHIRNGEYMVDHGILFLGEHQFDLEGEVLSLFLIDIQRKKDKILNLIREEGDTNKAQALLR